MICPLVIASVCLDIIYIDDYDVFIMRTTLSIDDDVLERARAVAAQLRTPFKTVINEALRAGLDQVEQPAKQQSYRTEPHEMGLRPGRNLDNIQELLAQIEGEEFR